MNRKKGRPRLTQFKCGYETTFAGWKLTLLPQHAVKVDHPTHSDKAVVIELDMVTGPVLQYSKAERVPRTVRAAVKSLVRKSVAREMQK